jgi:hypothetical protein
MTKLMKENIVTWNDCTHCLTKYVAASWLFSTYILLIEQNDKAKYSHYTVKRENGTPL